MAGLSDLGDRALAELMRKSIRTGPAQPSALNSAQWATAKADAPIDNDLQGYLRRLHRRLDSSEVAELLDYKVETVYRRIKCEGLPAHKDGTRWKFDPAEIARWIEKRDERPKMIRPPMRVDDTTQA